MFSIRLLSLSVPAVPGVAPPKVMPARVVVGPCPSTLRFWSVLFWAPAAPLWMAMTTAEVPVLVFWIVNSRSAGVPPTTRMPGGVTAKVAAVEPSMRTRSAPFRRIKAPALVPEIVRGAPLGLSSSV
jgi:hypothetical protein